ncbi:MAG: RHS repeat-associated core domain-containing protein [Bacteroidetes bacterium]|nr:RHS repeat-associated core domain-containing protein [Bacteroidota bacterium]
MRRPFSVILFMLIILPCIAQPGGQNYVMTRAPFLQISGVAELNNLPSQYLQTRINYFDGIGRKVQEIGVQASAAKNDIISTIQYDKAGRVVRNYLPFTGGTKKGDLINDPVGSIESFYANPPENVTGTSLPYAENVFDNSPLNEITEQSAPGESWSLAEGHTIHMALKTNGQAVPKWIVNSDGSCRVSGTYPAGSLLLTEITDENDNITREYKDKLGQVILKEALLQSGTAKTYYVYDRLGDLRMVIPPKAAATLSTYESLVYRYRYDDRHRMIEKKIPGQEIVEMVWDKLDRLVLSRDGNLRNDSLWIFYKYDVYGRQVVEGLYKNHDSRASLQNSVNSSGQIFETITGGEYQNNAFPKVNITPQKYFFYDNYDFVSQTKFEYNQAFSSGDVPESGIYPQQSTKTINKITGERVVIPGTGQWLTTVSYYDKHGRVIQSVSDNHLGGTDRVSLLYDFPGKILKTVELHTVNKEEFTKVKKRYEYDHAGRLKRIFHKVNEQGEVVLFENEYNELGEIVTKKLHGNNGSFLQETDYRYNIRGWLISINDPSGLGSDLFAMNLGYESGIAGLGAEAQYNGNISSTSWRTAGNLTVSGFGYKYDRLNRLTSATFGEYAGGWGPSAEDHSVPHIGYDLNGNIDTLTRMGLTGPGQFGLMDGLKYYYEGNRLLAVDDGAPYNVNDFDFSDGLSKYSGNPVDSEYSYDANGNMISDDNKGIQEIIYNHLNLPAEIYLENDRAIHYLYDANGNKLRKIVFGEQGKIDYIRDYSGAFVYTDGALDFILTDEGRVNNKVEGLIYEYFLKDHLGNTRVSFEVDNGTINTTGETHYYPFGMTLHGLNQPMRRHRDPVKSQYLYNGKELQQDNGLEWYDYGARFYDAQLGRFHTIDPLTEWHFKYTPYHYTFNNPIRYIDIMGLDTTEVNSKSIWAASGFWFSGSLEWKIWGFGVGGQLGPLKGNVEANVVKAEGTIKKEGEQVIIEGKGKLGNAEVKGGINNIIELSASGNVAEGTFLINNDGINVKGKALSWELEVSNNKIQSSYKRTGSVFPKEIRTEQKNSPFGSDIDNFTMGMKVKIGPARINVGWNPAIAGAKGILVMDSYAKQATGKAPPMPMFIIFKALFGKK